MTAKQAARKFHFPTLTPAEVQAIPFLRFHEISEILEDQNHHSENTLFHALRYGDEADVREGRAILAGHQAAGHLTPQLANRRAALTSKLIADPAIPQAPAQMNPQIVEVIAKLKESISRLESTVRADGWQPGYLANCKATITSYQHQVTKWEAELAATPATPPTVTIPQDLFEKIAVALYGASTHPAMPEAARSRYFELFEQSCEIPP